jgi:hypothetical protein
MGPTRSMLETDQKLAGLDSNKPSVKPNAKMSHEQVQSHARRIESHD